MEESLLELTVVVDAVPDGGLDRLHHQHGAGGWGLLAWYWGLLLLTPPYTPASATRAGGVMKVEGETKEKGIDYFARLWTFF